MRPLVSFTLVSKAGCTASNFRAERRLALEERIDAIGKKPKAVRRKKKGDDDVDVGAPPCSKAYANSTCLDCGLLSRRHLCSSSRPNDRCGGQG